MSIGISYRLKCFGIYSEECEHCLYRHESDCMFEFTFNAYMGYDVTKQIETVEGGHMKSGNVILVRKKKSMEIDERIGKNLRRLRERQGLSQSELARRIGTTPGRISDIESGKRRVSITFVIYVSQLLECDPVELFLNM